MVFNYLLNSAVAKSIALKIKLFTMFLNTLLQTYLVFVD